MTDHGLGHGFDALPLEAQVRALRDHAIGQELMVAVMFEAVKRLGVNVVWPADDGPADGEGDAT